jgi:hypothetical protein
MKIESTTKAVPRKVAIVAAQTVRSLSAGLSALGAEMLT